MDFWWALDAMVALILVVALVRSFEDRDNMKRQRDIAVRKVREHEDACGRAMEGWDRAIKMTQERDRRISDLLSRGTSQKEGRAVKTLQAELAAARKVLNENGLLTETHKGGTA